MDDLARNLDAMKLAERLQGITREQLWLHLEAEGPLEKYPAKQHARRVRDRLGVAEGLVYLPGAPARNNEDSDMPAPFRQRRYFYYLSGCNEAGCHLTYDIKQDTLTLFIPRVNPDRVFWNGRGSTPAEALDKYDIDEVFYVDQLDSWIQDWFLHYRYDGSQRLYVLHKEQIPRSQFPWPVNSSSLQPAINHCRMIKDDHEIRLIRKANDISSKAHKQILANIAKFDNEAQVEGLFLNVCISNQAKQQAYDPIAASGPNAGTLHYDANNEDFGDRQLMCLDAGCEFELYASDITRTFPLSSSWPSKEAENIYKLVERMQEACIQKLAPGVRYLDLHILAHQIAIDGLLKLGILHNGTREEIYKAGTSKAFFPHGLGHHVGLEVHDVGQWELMSLYKHSKYEKVPSLYPEDFHLPVYDKDLCMAPTHPESPHLEEGMIVTVEPGIYFSAYVLSYFYLPSPVHSKYINTEVLYRYFPVGGVRIEDDLLITSKGYENLTTAPKGDAMLEIIRSQGASSTSKLKKRMHETTEEPLRRAPGISKRVADPALKPISRAVTEPVKNPARTNSEEKYAFQDHWLFRESRGLSPHASDKQKGKAHQLGEQASAAPQKDQFPLCGTPSLDVEHIFIGWQHGSGRYTPSPYLDVGMKLAVKPKCQQCVVLSETVDRLRKTLSQSTKTSPKSSPKSETGHHGALDNIPTTGASLNKRRSSTAEKIPEMEQISRLAPRMSTDGTSVGENTRKIRTEADVVRSGQIPMKHEEYVQSHEPRLSGTGYSHVRHSIPEPHLQVPFKISEPFPLSFQRGLENKLRNKMNDNITTLSQVKAPRRSVTFDSYPITYHAQPPVHLDEMEEIPDSDSWYCNTNSMIPKFNSRMPTNSQRADPEALPHQRRYVDSRQAQHAPQAISSGNFDLPPPASLQTSYPKKICPASAYYEPPTCFPLSPPVARTSETREVAIKPNGLALRGLPATRERTSKREQHIRPLDSMRRLDPRLSLPALHQGSAGEIAKEEPAALRSRRSMFVPPVLSPQEQDLRHRRSMGSALRPVGDNGVPQSQPPLSSEHPNAPGAGPSIPFANNWNDRAFPSVNLPALYERSTQPTDTHNRLSRQSVEKNFRNMYGMSRPGGEELKGIDYAEW